MEAPLTTGELEAQATNEGLQSTVKMGRALWI